MGNNIITAVDKTDPQIPLVMFYTYVPNSSGTINPSGEGLFVVPAQKKASEINMLKLLFIRI